MLRLLELPKTSPFDATRQFDADGEEFWSARDLMDFFQYDNWQTFKRVLAKARRACENSGKSPEDNFMNASKRIVLNSGIKRFVQDMHLTRYACYPVAQNGHPSKPMVAMAQSYIAIQTMRHRH
jgi:DNA-damage-inducible protein D